MRHCRSRCKRYDPALSEGHSRVGSGQASSVYRCAGVTGGGDGQTGRLTSKGDRLASLVSMEWLPRPSATCRQCGIAGGVDPGLHIGDVVTADRWRQYLELRRLRAAAKLRGPAITIGIVQRDALAGAPGTRLVGNADVLRCWSLAAPWRPCWRLPRPRRLRPTMSWTTCRASRWCPPSHRNSRSCGMSSRPPHRHALPPALSPSGRHPIRIT